MGAKKYLSAAGSILVGGGLAALATLGLARVPADKMSANYRNAVLAGGGLALGLAAQIPQSPMVNSLGVALGAGGLTVGGASYAAQMMAAQAAAQQQRQQPPPQMPPAGTGPSAGVYGQTAYAQR